MEEGHKYIYLPDPTIKFTSGTGLVSKYHDHFDEEKEATRLATTGTNPKYVGKTKQEILDMWEFNCERGSELHAFGESLFDGWKMPKPKFPQAPFVKEYVNWCKNSGYKIAQTEILVYDLEKRICGQADIFLKYYDAYGTKKYLIHDYKFLTDPLNFNGFFDRKTKKYKKMSGIFKHLNDCNYAHYSIQLAIYEMMLNMWGIQVEEKCLIVILENKWTVQPTIPMTMWFNDAGELHAQYITNGWLYNSESDKFVKKLK